MSILRLLWADYISYPIANTSALVLAIASVFHPDPSRGDHMLIAAYLMVMSTRLPGRRDNANR